MPVFRVDETHGRAMRAGNRMIANSQDVGWRSLHAAILEEGPFAATEPPIGHPMLIYHLTRPTEVSRKIEGGPANRQLIGPRRICLTPGGATTRWEHHGHPEILQVYLRSSIYQAAVGEIHNCDTAHAELVPRFATMDPMLEQLAIALATALRDGTARRHCVRWPLNRHTGPADGRPSGAKPFRTITARANSSDASHLRLENETRAGIH
jgi:AraC family transcriptional regulator